MTSVELSELIDRQKAFFSTGKTLEVAFRKEQLLKLRDALVHHQEDILAALTADLHKSPVEAYATELGILISEINFIRRRLPLWSLPTLRPTR